MEEAYNRGSTDNLAAVVVDLGLRDWAARGSLHGAGPRQCQSCSRPAPRKLQNRADTVGKHAVQQNRQAEALGENCRGSTWSVR